MDIVVRIFKGLAGAVASFFLGLHAMIQLLVYAIVADIATGILRAWVNKDISSEVTRRGVARKAMILIAVAAAEIAGKYLGFRITMPWGAEWGIGAAVAGYYAVHEAISILENLGAAGVPFPEFLKGRLVRLRETLDEKGKTDEKPH